MNDDHGAFLLPKPDFDVFLQHKCCDLNHMAGIAPGCRVFAEVRFLAARTAENEAGKRLPSSEH